MVQIKKFDNPPVVFNAGAVHHGDDVLCIDKHDRIHKVGGNNKFHAARSDWEAHKGGKRQGDGNCKDRPLPRFCLYRDTALHPLNIAPNGVHSDSPPRHAGNFLGG